MVCSGILSLLEVIYAEHTVPHFLSGKVHSVCATRVHLITAAVFSGLLIGNIHDIDFNLNVDGENFATKFHKALIGKKKLSKLARIMDEILTKKIVSIDLTISRRK